MNEESKFKLERQTSLIRIENKELKMGMVPFDWTGKELPSRIEHLPEGYIGQPNFREWRPGRDTPNYLTYGPYFQPEYKCVINNLIFLIDCNYIQKENPKAPVFTVDCVDHNGKRADPWFNDTYHVDVLAPHEGGCMVYYKGSGIVIEPGMSIETRVFVHGNAVVRCFGLHWGIESTSL